MAAPAKVAVIDADAHVVEAAQTWEYMDPEDSKYRPVPVEVPGDTRLQYWLIDGKVRGFRFPAYTTTQLEELSRLAGRTMTTTREASEMTNVSLRLRRIEANRQLIDPYFYPLFEEASRLNLAIAVHIANGNPWLTDLFRHTVFQAAAFDR